MAKIEKHRTLPERCLEGDHKLLEFRIHSNLLIIVFSDGINMNFKEEACLEGKERINLSLQIEN
jgi:hypothetical protein